MRQLGDRGAVGELDHRVHDRLRVHHHLDLVVVDAEQLVGLDHLEALVHQRRRVDRDLRAHLPRRVGQRLVDVDVGELGARAAAERPAAGGEHDPGDLAAGVADAAQALVDGAVLAVDRHELGARRRPQRLHDRAAGDEALLVGQRQALAALQRAQR